MDDLDELHGGQTLLELMPYGEMATRYANAVGLYQSSDIYKTRPRAAQIAKLAEHLRGRRDTRRATARTVHGRGQA